MSDSPLFELKVAGRLNNAVSAPQIDSYSERRRQAAEDGRQAVQPYINEALLSLVYLMRFSKDEQMIFKCAMKILDRGWGLAKPLPPDDPGAVGNGNSIIDLLAAASKHVGALERNGGLYGAVPAPQEIELLEHDAPIQIVPQTAEDAEFIDFLNKSASDA